MFWVACVILWQLSCCVLTMNPRNPMPQLTSLQKEAFELQGLSVLCKALWNPQMKDIAEMSLFVFFFFNRTNHPKEEQSQFGWPALRGFVFVKPQNQNKYVAGSTVQFYIWQHCRWHTVVLCMLGLSFPEHQQSETVFLCHLFLAWSLPCCGAFLWSVKWEQLGSPAAVTGIPLMVFQRCQAGEVYQSHGEVAVQRCCWRNELMLLSPLPAHRPFHLFRFRAKRWKWSQCRCLQDVAWRQRTI